MIEEFGTASGNRELNDTIAQDLQRAGYLSLPVTLAILLVASGASASRKRLAGPAAAMIQGP